MSQLPDVIEIGPREEAERLWRGAVVAYAEADNHLLKLLEAIDLGARATEILVSLKLQPVRNRFPASIATLLESPDPAVDPKRDAISVPPSLTFLNVIDMLSEESLGCVSRKLHHGWEDRQCACRRARALAQESLHLTLDARSRDLLLELEAYRNRIFRISPPVRIVPSEILESFPALVRLYEALALPRAA